MLTTCLAITHREPTLLLSVLREFSIQNLSSTAMWMGKLYNSLKRIQAKVVGMLRQLTPCSYVLTGPSRKRGNFVRGVPLERKSLLSQALSA